MTRSSLSRANDCGIAFANGKIAFESRKIDSRSSTTVSFICDDVSLLLQQSVHILQCNFLSESQFHSLIDVLALSAILDSESEFGE